MRSPRPSLVRRPIAVTLIALLLTAALALPAPATAQELSVSATFYGFVQPDADGLLPLRVRAVGSNDVTCGTSNVTPIGEHAFYLLQVVSAADRDGCPAAGGDVAFVLLHGAVDPGVRAVENGTWAAGVQRLDLTPGAPVDAAGGFAGTLPAGAGFARLTWQGADATPIDDALATLARPVDAVYAIQDGLVLRHFPAAPSLSTLETLSSGDLVIVVVR